MFWKDDPEIFLPFSLFQDSHSGLTRKHINVTHLPVTLVVLKTAQELYECYHCCVTLHLPKNLSETVLNLSC